MQEYARMLRRSGYTERFRHEVITDALRCHHKMQEVEARGGRPVDRPRDYQEVERRWRRWHGDEVFRRLGRGAEVGEGVDVPEGGGEEWGGSVVAHSPSHPAASLASLTVLGVPVWWGSNLPRSWLAKLYF